MMSMKKKQIDQNGPHGMCDTASGYATKASPNPEEKKCIEISSLPYSLITSLC